MDTSVRPRRSALYVPGANTKALAKAKTLSADLLILDLEDAVAPDAKVEARQRVVEFARTSGFGRSEVAIRVNGRGTRWHADDLTATVAAGVDAVVVPKVNSAADVLAIDGALTAAGAPQGMKIWAMLETPQAVIQAFQIADCSPRLTVLVMGTNDLAKELHVEQVPGRQPLWFALSACVLAARAAGKNILDGVFNDLTNGEGLEAECRQGRQMGFDGKTLIHPCQLETCHQVFTPSADEIAHAQRIVTAFQQAQAEGKGVVTLDGQMIENVHLASAERVLAMQRAIR